MLIRHHVTDRKAAESGKWFTFDGSQFLLAAAGTAGYNRSLREEGQRRKRDLRKGGLDADKAVAELTVDVMAKTVLLDWKDLHDNQRRPDGSNALDDDGNPVIVEVPYSLDMAYRLLRECQDFRQWVENTCLDLQNFVLEDEAAAAGELKSRTALGNGVGEGSGVPAGAGGAGPDEPAPGTP